MKNLKVKITVFKTVKETHEVEIPIASLRAGSDGYYEADQIHEEALAIVQINHNNIPGTVEIEPDEVDIIEMPKDFEYWE